MIDSDRLNHSYAVAQKMKQIGKDIGLTENQIEELFLLGFVHDIGYEYAENGINHNKIGGEILRKSGFKHWKEVYYHGQLTQEYSSLYLDILNYADMQVDKYGKDVGFEQRLEDIGSRYGKDSVVYERCLGMIQYLKNKFSTKGRDEER